MSSLVPLLRTCAVRTIPRRLLHISTPLYRDVYGFGQSATEPEVSAVRESRNATRRKLKEVEYTNAQTDSESPGGETIVTTDEPYMFIVP